MLRRVGTHVRAAPLLGRHRRRGHWPVRRLPAVVLGALVIVGAAAAAWAYYSATSVPGGSGAGTAASVNQGSTPTVSAQPGRAVQVTWSAVTLTNTQPVAGYLVRRYDSGTSALQTTLSGCSGTITALTCTENVVPTGSWKYAVVPVIGSNWQGAESATSGTVTVGNATFSLAKSVFGPPLPNSTTGTLTGFAANEGLTYRLDAATSLTGSPAVADASGNATITSLTIPAGTGSGAHTVWVIGSGGTTASYGILVDTVAPTASALLSPAANGNGWNNVSPVAVTLAGDDGGGSGVSQIRYTTDGTDPTPTTGSVYSVALSITVTTTVKFLAADVAGNASGVYTQQVRIDTAAPTNAITVSDANGNAFKNGNNVYYRGTAPASRSFTLTNTLTDAGSSGVASSSTAALGGTATGWTHTSSTVNTPAPGPYVSNTFGWTLNNTMSPTEAVTGADLAGNTSTTTLTFLNDSTLPSGGSVSYPDGTNTTMYVSVAFTPGTDSDSGLSPTAGRPVQRRSTTLSSGGVCDTANYSAFADVSAGNVTSPFVDTTLVGGNCYQYAYQVLDNVGNVGLYTIANTVMVPTYAAEVSTTAGAVAHWRLGDTGSMILSKDTFVHTGGANVNLNTHTGETAATWTRNAGSSSNINLEFDNDRVRRTTAGYALYTVGSVMPTADYAVEAKLIFPTSTVNLDKVGVAGRLNTGTNQFYWAGLSHPDALSTSWVWSIQTMNAATGAVVSTLAGPVAQANPNTASFPSGFVTRLEMVGSSLELYVNGVPTLAVNNSALTTAGLAGIYDGAVGSGTKDANNTTGGHIDDFVIAPPKMADSVGTNHGFYRSVPTLGDPGALAGDPDTAVTFTGTNYGSVPDQTALDVGDTFSLEAWAKRSATQSTAQSIITKGIGSTGFQLRFETDNTLSLLANGSVIVKTTTTQTDTTVFHHYVATKSGAAVKLYVDGIDRTGTVANSTVVNTNDPLYIGAKDTTERFTGTLDEVAIYNTVLSGTTVQAHHDLATQGARAGSVDAAALGGTGSRYSTSTALSIVLNKGTTTGTFASGAQLWVSTAALTSAGNANGACGTYSVPTQVGGNDPASPVAQTATTATCYRYTYLVPDTLGVATYVSGDIKVDTTPPTAPTLTFSGLSATTYWSGSGTTIYYQASASSGNFTATATGPTDAESGFTGSYTMPNLGAGWTTPSGTTGVQTYSYSTTNPTTAVGAQSVTVANNAGGANTATGITLVNDALPVLTPSGGTTAHNENVAIAVDSGITVTDSDTANMVSGTVTIGTGYTAGQDVLAFTNQLGITGSWSAPTLTLTGNTTKLNWQTALRAITYNNTSDTPNTANRTINFAVSDGIFNSTTAAKTVSVTAVNDAPVNSVPGAQTAFAGTAKVFSSGNGNLISISDPDAASSAVQVQLVSTNGTTTLSGTAGLTFSVGDGTADATMTFTGTITNINTALAGLGFTGTAGGAASLQIITNDQGNTGTGGPLTDNDTISITVTDYGLFTTAADVGAGTPSGTSSSYASGSGVYTEVGNGADINGTADQFHYLYKSWTGDGTIIARVTSFTNTSVYAKAGVMFRESTVAGSKYARMDIKPVGGDGSEWGYRSALNGATTQSGTPGIQPTYWVKLVRSGNTFTGYNAPDVSGNPGSWTQRGTQSITMASTILVGLATCSHNSAALATATYDKVTVQ